MTVSPDVMNVPCARPDCRHVRQLLAQSAPLTDLDAARARIVELSAAAAEAYKALKVEAMTDGLSNELDEAMDHLREVLAIASPGAAPRAQAAPDAQPGVSAPGGYVLHPGPATDAGERQPLATETKPCPSCNGPYCMDIGGMLGPDNCWQARRRAERVARPADRYILTMDPRAPYLTTCTCGWSATHRTSQDAHAAVDQHFHPTAGGEA